MPEPAGVKLLFQIFCPIFPGFPYFFRSCPQIFRWACSPSVRNPPRWCQINAPRSFFQIIPIFPCPCKQNLRTANQKSPTDKEPSTPVSGPHSSYHSSSYKSTAFPFFIRITRLYWSQLLSSLNRYDTSYPKE